MTDTQTQTAVRYDRDADGIVTLTLDDPTASANTMNELYQASMQAAVERLYDEQDEVTGVVHLAAKKAVGESVERPHFYYRQNVEGAMALTEAMAEVGVRRLVYSSSASVYGPTDAPLITEDSATLPISPYGQTKLIGEWIGACVE